MNESTQNHQQQYQQEQFLGGNNRIRDRENYSLIHPLQQSQHNHHSTNNELVEIKSQLSLLNQQLLLPLLSNTISTTTATTSNNQQQQQQSSSLSSPIQPIELIKIISQLEQQCDKLTQINLQVQTDQQQNHMDKHQILIEQERLKIQQKEINIERREFELSKRESQSHQPTSTHNVAMSNQYNQQHEQFQQPTSNSSTSLLLLSSDPPLLMTSDIVQFNQPPQQDEQHQIQNQEQHEQEQSPPQTQYIELLQHVLQDYQAMKYLVDQSTTTQQVFNNNVQQLQQLKTQLDTNSIKFDEYEIKMVEKMDQLDEYQSKLDDIVKPIETTVQQHNNQLKVLEAARQEQIKQRQQRLQKIEDKRKQVQLVLDENAKLEKDKYEWMIFQFENLPNIRISCSNWKFRDLFNIIRNWVIEKYMKKDLEQYIPTIENGKLFISTKSILGGEWIQVQGDGKVVDIDDLSLSKLLKPGDDIYDYKDYPCSKNCSKCKGQGAAPTLKRFLIKIKWE